MALGADSLTANPLTAGVEAGLLPQPCTIVIFGGSGDLARRLLLNVMAGDATLFMRRDAVEASWAWVEAVQETWEQSGARWLPEYPAGSWGPVEADRMIQADGRAWRTL
jgi:glucose-6-phosphate 1-dehydrogenase